MTKILVLYYSRTGLTQTIARQVARACNADLEAIEDVTGRDGATGYVRSALEAAMHREAPIRRATRVPGDYDIVVIGTPIWFWNVASPVRTYIQRHRRQFRRVAFFCTYGGSGQAKVLADLEQLCGRPAVATLAVVDADITGKRYHEQLAKFSAALRTSGRLLRGRRPGQDEFGKSSPGL